MEAQQFSSGIHTLKEKYILTSPKLSDKIIELRYDADEWPEIYGLIPQHPRKLSFSYKTAVEYIGMWRG